MTKIKVDTVTIQQLIEQVPSEGDPLCDKARDAFSELIKPVVDEGDYSRGLAICRRLLIESFEVSGPNECCWIGMGLKLEDFLSTGYEYAHPKPVEKIRAKKAAWQVRGGIITWLGIIVDRNSASKKECLDLLMKMLALPLDESIFNSVIFALKDCEDAADETIISALINHKGFDALFSKVDHKGPSIEEIHRIFDSDNMDGIQYPIDNETHKFYLFDCIARIFKRTKSSAITKWLNQLLANPEELDWVKKYAEGVLTGKDVRIHAGPYGATYFHVEE